MTTKDEGFKVFDEVYDRTIDATGVVIGSKWVADLGQMLQVRYRKEDGTLESPEDAQPWWSAADYEYPKQGVQPWDNPANWTEGEPTNAAWAPLGFVEEEKWPRQSALEEAISLTCGDRNVQYGDPLSDFKRIAALLNALEFSRLGRPLKGSDVAVAMAALKLSRLTHDPSKRDSWVDLAGYAGCGYENAIAEAAE